MSRQRRTFHSFPNETRITEAYVVPLWNIENLFDESLPKFDFSVRHYITHFPKDSYNRWVTNIYKREMNEYSIQKLHQVNKNNNCYRKELFN